MSAHISVPMYQRTIPQRYQLVAHKCVNCGKINFPPKGICKYCKKMGEFEEVKLSGKGEIYSYTVIASGGAPPEFADQAQAKGEYVVGLVELDEGPKIAGQIVNIATENLSIGMQVKAELRRIYEQEEVIRYGYKFTPDLT